YLVKLGSSTSTAGSGYRWVRSQAPNACGLDAAIASAALPVATMVRLVGSMGSSSLGRGFGGSIGEAGRRTTDDRRRKNGASYSAAIRRLSSVLCCPFPCVALPQSRKKFFSKPAEPNHTEHVHPLS